MVEFGWLYFSMLKDIMSLFMIGVGVKPNVRNVDLLI